MPVVEVSPIAPISETFDRRRIADQVEVLRSELLDVLASVPDPRHARGRRCPPAGLLAIAILAVAARMRSYAGFAMWARTVPEDLSARLGIRHRRPSGKTFRRVLSALDAADLDRRLGEHFTRLAVAAATDASGLMAVSLDGETLKGARKAGAVASHLVSMFAHHTRLVPAQLAVDEKSNEIPCVRKLLKSFPRIEPMVVMDATHTQVLTAKLICKTMQSHYLLVVKANQPSLPNRITALPRHQIPIVATDDTRGHGRDEKRSFRIVAAPRGIGFPYAEQVIRITRERLEIAGGKLSTEVVHAIVSLPFEHARPAMIAAWPRRHWGMENAIHRVRDVTLDEDRSMAAARDGPRVMAAIRNAALNLHRIDGATNIAEACRETALSAEKGVHLLSQQIPSSKAR